MDIKLNKNIITASIVNIIFNRKINLNQCYKVILASLLLSALSAIGLLNFKWGIFQHQLPIKKFQEFSFWTLVYLKINNTPRCLIYTGKRIGYKRSRGWYFAVWEKGPWAPSLPMSSIVCQAGSLADGIIWNLGFWILDLGFDLGWSGKKPLGAIITYVT